MSLVAARVVASALAVAAFAIAVVHKFVLQPLFWRVEPLALGFALLLVTLLLVAAGPPLVYLALTRRLRRRPAWFTVSTDGPAFVVPASPLYPGLAAVMLMWMAGNQVPAERVPDTDRMRLSTIPWMVPVSAAFVLVLTGVAVAYLCLVRLTLILTPIGVTVRWALRSQEIRWQDLLPGGPLVPGRRDWTMPLWHGRAGARPKCLKVPLGLLYIDRVFLATVIRHYTEHPEHRGAIGSHAELERLETGFAAWRLPEGQPAHTTAAS